MNGPYGIRESGSVISGKCWMSISCCGISHGRSFSTTLSMKPPVLLSFSWTNFMYPTDLSSSIRSISNVSIAALRAELVRRSEGQDADEEKSTCGSTRRGAYNTPVHVMALFLILVLSTIGTVGPCSCRREICCG